MRNFSGESLSTHHAIQFARKIISWIVAIHTRLYILLSTYYYYLTGRPILATFLNRGHIRNESNQTTRTFHAHEQRKHKRRMPLTTCFAPFGRATRWAKQRISMSRFFEFLLVGCEECWSWNLPLHGISFAKNQIRRASLGRRLSSCSSAMLQMLPLPLTQQTPLGDPDRPMVCGWMGKAKVCITSNGNLGM